MRITGNVLIGNMMKHLQKNMNKLDDLNQKLASGKQFQLPSENPIKVANSMQFNSMIENNEQYQRNLNQARNWLKSSETSLKDAGGILQRARELGVYGANDTLSAEDKSQIAEEVKQLYQGLINIGNSKLGDRYLFAGQSTSTQPFNKDGDYQGDQKQMQREINYGVSLNINVSGKEAFSPALKAVADLSDDLANDGDVESNLSKLDEAMNKIISLRSKAGAKLNRLDMTENRTEEEAVNLKRLLSENEDVDIAKTITDLKMEESVYRASLAVGARIMQPSLVDFLQ